ncbi:MAG TPA: hypothetical protein VFD92_05365 [Candidatus Binatia bacterium]|nr:hypothetical protein [Candidatus Binatia bacterium]
MRKLPHLLLCAILSLWLATPADAAPASGIVQLGGGYQMLVACDGTKIRVKRVGTDEVRVSCSPSVERPTPPLTATEVRLDPGESTTVFCQGLKLVAKRDGGARMRANCTSIPVPEI